MKEVNIYLPRECGMQNDVWNFLNATMHPEMVMILFT